MPDIKQLNVDGVIYDIVDAGARAIATQTTCGQVKVGKGLAVSSDGTLSVDLPNGDEVSY